MIIITTILKSFPQNADSVSAVVSQHSLREKGHGCMRESSEANARCLSLQSPQPFGKWKGVLDATQPVPKCVQRNVFVDEQEVSGQEDCLFINVYTPHVSVSTFFDIVHFHCFTLAN
jgi:hypothetical protein